MSHVTRSISHRICGHLVVDLLVHSILDVPHHSFGILERVVLSCIGLQLLTRVFAINTLDSYLDLHSVNTQWMKMPQVTFVL